MTDIPGNSRCFGKHGFEHKTDALRVIRERQVRARRDHHIKELKRSVANLIAYRCAECHFFHISASAQPRKLHKAKTRKGVKL